MKIQPKVDLVIDLQFGSTGKGLIAGYLAEKNGYDVVMTANMPNAGHTYINAQGRKWMHKVLPSGITSPNLKYVLIGPGAVFDIERLAFEIAQSEDILKHVEVFIHPKASVVQSSHKEAEAAGLSKVSSTMQGSAEASIEKMRRQPGSRILAEHFLDEIFEAGAAVLEDHQWREILEKADKVLAEGAQGYSLSLNGPFWPYCTSRDCTPNRFLADMAIPHKMLNKVIGTARVHPIRVGNTSDGFSGPIYSDQTELTWEEVGQVPELTTVTQRVRRVFSFSYEQIGHAIRDCCPDEIFLNFCNYAPVLAEEVADSIDRIGDSHGVGSFDRIAAANGFGFPPGMDGGMLVRYMGFGPTAADIRERF